MSTRDPDYVCDDCGADTNFAVRCDACEQERDDAFLRAWAENGLRVLANTPPLPPLGSLARRAHDASCRLMQFACGVAIQALSPAAAAREVPALKRAVRPLRGFAERLHRAAYSSTSTAIDTANVGRQAHDYIKSHAWFTNVSAFAWPPVQLVAEECWEVACYGALEHVQARRARAAGAPP